MEQNLGKLKNKKRLSYMFCFLPFYLFHVISWILGSLLSLPQVYLHNYRFLEWRQWHPTPVLLPGKSQGWRSLVGCSPWVSKSQTWLSDFTFTFYFHALEKELATHSSVLAWRIPGTEEPGGLPSMGLHRVGHDWSNLAAAIMFCPFSRNQVYKGHQAENWQWINSFSKSNCSYL